MPVGIYDHGMVWCSFCQEKREPNPPHKITVTIGLETKKSYHNIKSSTQKLSFIIQKSPYEKTWTLITKSSIFNL